jgi:Beta-propeller repeat
MQTRVNLKTSSTSWATLVRTMCAARVGWWTLLLGITAVTLAPTVLPASAARIESRTRAATITSTHRSTSASWYSTLFGGQGGDAAHAVAVDRWGNIYLAGETASRNFPTHAAVQTHLAGPAGTGVDTAQDDAGYEDAGYDHFLGVENQCDSEGAFVVKLSPLGRVIYSTYLGGNCADEAHAITVDQDGNAYIAGYTRSPNFPVLRPLKKGFARNDYCRRGGAVSCQDAFIAKLDPRGRLLFSTYFGGRENNGPVPIAAFGVSGDDAAHAIALDQRGNIYVAGETDSASFPGTSGQPISFGAFISKLSPDGSHVLATYIQTNSLSKSSSDDSKAYSMAINARGDVFVTGNGFLVKLTPSLKRIYALALQGDPRSVAADRRGNAYATGTLEDAHFTAIHGAQPHFGGGSCSLGLYNSRPCTDAFLIKVDPTGKTVYSTFLGGTDDDEGRAVTVDSSGSAYVAGITSGSFPTKNPIQSNFGGGDRDAFVVKIAPSGRSIVYSTYLGGSGLDVADAIALTPAGNPVVVGETDSSDFLISPTGSRVRVAENDASRIFLTEFPATPRILVQANASPGLVSWLTSAAVAAILIVFALFIWSLRRRRRRTKAASGTPNGHPGPRLG